MNKWEIQQTLRGKKSKNINPNERDYMLENADTVRVHWRKRTFVNNNERKVIKTITLYQEFIKEYGCFHSTIVVNFGHVLDKKDLEKFIADNQLNTKNSDKNTTENQEGITFIVKTNEELFRTLSTLDQLSPFSQPMKTAILRFIFPDIEINSENKKKFFSSNTQPFSLFNICLDKVNEDFHLARLLYLSDETVQKTIMDTIRTRKENSTLSPPGLKDSVSKDSAGNKFTSMQLSSGSIPSLFNLCFKKIKEEAMSTDIEGFSLKL